MNAAEHIVQSFFWQALSDKKIRDESGNRVRHYLTISNVIGGNNREVDVLAMSPDGRDRVRAECEIAVNWPLGADYIIKRIRYKMTDDPKSQDLIRSIWGDSDYRKVFVVWQTPEDLYPLPDDLRDEKVEVWSITDLLQDLLDSVGCSNFQDDVLRVMSMVTAMLSMENALRRNGCKRVSGQTVSRIRAIDCVNTVAELAKKCAETSGQATVSERHVSDALARIRQLSSGE